MTSALSDEHYDYVVNQCEKWTKKQTKRASGWVGRPTCKVWCLCSQHSSQGCPARWVYFQPVRFCEVMKRWARGDEPDYLPFTSLAIRVNESVSFRDIWHYQHWSVHVSPTIQLSPFMMFETPPSLYRWSVALRRWLVRHFECKFSAQVVLLVLWPYLDKRCAIQQ